MWLFLVFWQEYHQKKNSYNTLILKELSVFCCLLAFLLVIQLGFEPRTPTLKVLCSTGWATESFNRVSQLRLQRYIFLFLTQIYFELFSRIFYMKRVKTSLWFNWVSHSLIVNSDKRLKWSVYVTCFTK